MFRAPVNGSPLLVKIINGLSSKNIPYEKLFHLGFLISIGGARIRIEKNEVIDIDEVYTLKPDTETILVPPTEVKIILNDFLNTAVNKFGKERILSIQLLNIIVKLLSEMFLNQTIYIIMKSIVLYINRCKVLFKI